MVFVMEDFYRELKQNGKEIFNKFEVIRKKGEKPRPQCYSIYEYKDELYKVEFMGIRFLKVKRIYKVRASVESAVVYKEI